MNLLAVVNCRCAT